MIFTYKTNTHSIADCKLRKLSEKTIFTYNTDTRSIAEITRIGGKNDFYVQT